MLVLSYHFYLINVIINKDSQELLTHRTSIIEIIDVGFFFNNWLEMQLSKLVIGVTA